MLLIKINLQSVGLGTAPTEMMDIFGLGTNDKDIIISLGEENVVKTMMANFGTTFSSHSKYGGLMIILKVSAASRLLTELLDFNNEKNTFFRNRPLRPRQRLLLIHRARRRVHL